MNSQVSGSDLVFKNKSNNSSLICTNTTDQFSTFNLAAPLKYKVGLPTKPEVNILNDTSILGTFSDSFWLMSPTYYDQYYTSRGAWISYIYNGYIISSNRSDYQEGIRPAISLIPGIKYSDGDGSKEHPYIIKTN